MQESQDREERERAEARDKIEQQLQKDRDNMEIHRRALRDKEYIEKKYALLEQEAAGENESRAGDFLEDRRNWHRANVQLPNRHFLCELTQKLRTDRLTPQIWLNWADKRFNLTLKTLGEWLYQLAVAVSDVTMPQTSENRAKKRQQS